MLIDKEEEIHAALQALYAAYTTWVSTRKTFNSFQNNQNPIVNPLEIMPYEMVIKAKDKFEAKRDTFLALAKSWEKELP